MSDLAESVDIELMFKPATELAEDVRSGQISARELVENSLSRIEALDKQINAFTFVDGEQALEAADTINKDDQRPLAGVPFALKDLGLMAEGMPMTMGSDLVGDFICMHDSNVTRRLREAGCIFVGRTASPEFGLPPVTEARRYGPTRNPWSLEHTPGGSSGGAAAAVAAGMIPAAHASDGGGSIRIPAACCGLVGLKPTRGRISLSPDMGEAVSGLGTDGVVTRTVKDSALMLDLLQGYEAGDPYWAPPPEKSYQDAAAEEPGKLKIGITSTAPIEVDVDSEIAGMVEKTGELLSSLGHDVGVAAPEWQNPMLRETFTQLWTVSASQAVFFAQILSGGAEVTKENIEPLSWTLNEMGHRVSAPELLNIQFGMHAFSRQVVTFWDSYDILVTPVFAKPQVKIGEIDTCNEENPLGELQKAGDFVPFTPVFNVTGQPAISLPLYQGENGLPIGIQFAGAPGREDILLSLASQLEEAQPWAERRPSL